jgi:hypothetical protein
MEKTSGISKMCFPDVFHRRRRKQELLDQLAQLAGVLETIRRFLPQHDSIDQCLRDYQALKKRCT